jgi:hypothetical protein
MISKFIHELRVTSAVHHVFRAVLPLEKGGPMRLPSTYRATTDI